MLVVMMMTEITVAVAMTMVTGVVAVVRMSVEVVAAGSTMTAAVATSGR